MAAAADSLRRTAAGSGREGALHHMRLLVVVAPCSRCVPAALAGPGLRVGAVEDAAIWNDPGAEMDLAKLAGFDSIRMTAQWTAGQTVCRPARSRACSAPRSSRRCAGSNPIVSIYNAGGELGAERPGARARSSSSSRRRSSRALPGVTTFIVGNEPNSSVYWQPQFDAAGGDAAAKSYEQLLAATYDGIKAARPTATVIGGALDSHGNDVPTGVALADDVHPRPRARVPRERPHGADHGRLRRARVRRHVGAAAEHAARRLDDRRGRLREARRAPRQGVRRDGAARLDAADLLRRIRRRDRRSRPTRRASTPASETQKTVDEATQAQLLRGGVPARALPAERDRDHGLPRRRRERARRLAVRAVLRRRHAEVVAARDPRRRARGARAGSAATCPDRTPPRSRSRRRTARRRRRRPTASASAR